MAHIWILASLTSSSWNFPNDELALKDAISRLNADWSALDSRLKFWILLVVIGVATELFIVVVEYWHERREFLDAMRGMTHAPKPPVLWMYVVGFLGAGLVALGVAGEFSIHSRLSKVETDLRDDNEQLVSIADERAQEASKLASANELEAQQLKAANLKLEAAIQPRTINEADRKKLGEGLHKFASSFQGRKVTIASQIGDAESMLVALEIADILSNANIQFDPTGTGRTSWVGAVFMGVRITGPPSDRVFVSKFVEELFIPLNKGVFGM